MDIVRVLRTLQIRVREDERVRFRERLLYFGRGDGGFAAAEDGGEAGRAEEEDVDCGGDQGEFEEGAVAEGGGEGGHAVGSCAGGIG